MNFKFSNRINQLEPSGIRKVNEKALQMEKSGDDIIHFELGRPDFDTPAYIKQACIKSLEAGDVYYTSNFGNMKLRETIAEKLNRENHIDYKPKEILVTVGLAEAIFDILCILLDEGDEILVPNPVWINYLNIPKLFGANPVSYNLLEENDFQLNLEEIRGKITNKTKILVLITPNNPTGGVLGEDVIKGIAEIAKQHDLLVISDEIYERLIYDNEKHISIASYPGMKERTITCNGLSKAYSMTGWRLGYVAAPEELIVQLNKVHQHNTTCAPSFVQTAAITALKEEGDEVKNMVKEYEKRRNYAVEAINKIEGLSCNIPKGSFYIYINIKNLGITSQKLAGYLLEEAKIALVPGDVFGSNGEGYIRMSFANSYENIVDGCNRLKAAIEKLNK